MKAEHVDALLDNIGEFIGSQRQAFCRRRVVSPFSEHDIEPRVYARALWIRPKLPVAPRWRRTPPK